MVAKKVLAIVLAGGEGKRLMPLTLDRAKPAVPFGGTYRLIDFALSNIVNSGYLQVIVLTQYKSHSLDTHIAKTWRMSSLLGNFVAPVPAQQRMGKHWYLGSADAIFQNLNIIRDYKPDYIVVVGADHVYRMDFSQMVDAHVESGMDCTVAAIRQPLADANQFGVIETDPEDPGKIARFVEKPETTEPLTDDPASFLASMGNYVFTADALVAALEDDAKNPSSAHDMGGDIVPYFVEREGAGVYDFIHNQIPGSEGRDKYYWRDVGTLDAFYEAHMDLISVHPIFNLYNTRWPVYTESRSALAPAKFVHSDAGRVGTAIDSIVSAGTVISGAQVSKSVLGTGVVCHSWAAISDSILMDDVEVGRFSQVHRAILDKGIVVPPGTQIGLDHERDRARGFTVTESGITVVGKGTIIDPAS